MINISVDLAFNWFFCETPNFKFITEWYFFFWKL